MPWIFLAALSHSINAFVFIIDKSLLGRAGKVAQPAWYAAYSGVVAGAAFVLLFFSFAPPTTFIALWSLIAGVLWLAALWLFFIALKKGEPSRVVPVTGSVVPFFTWLLAVTFLGERLAGGQLLAVGLLIVGGFLLSVRLNGAASSIRPAAVPAVGSGLAFAAYFAVAKFVYDRFDPFLAAFAYIRLGVGVAAVALLLWLFLFAPRRRSRTLRKKRRINLMFHSVFLGNKGLGMAALLLQNWAIALGSVTVVNALQGVQYVVLLLLAWAVSRYFPQLFREELTRVTWLQKAAGISFVSVGLVLLLVRV